jgi:hypothetical protein
VREADGSFSQLYKTIVGVSVCVGKRKTAVLYSWLPVLKKMHGICRIKLKWGIGLDTIMADSKSQKLNIQIHMLAHYDW